MHLRVERGQQILDHTHIAVTDAVKQALADGILAAHIGDGIARKDDSIHILKNHFSLSLSSPHGPGKSADAASHPSCVHYIGPFGK